MKRTDLGKWSVSFRLDRDMLHREMADKLGVSASYLSSIEHGRKVIPDDWWKRICRTFDLTLPEASSLKIAIMRSQRTVTVPVETEHEARLLVAYVENRSNISAGTAEKIEAIMQVGAYGTEKQKSIDS